MFKYILKRLVQSVFILIGVSMIIYFLIRLMPVDFIQDKINAINQGGATVSQETVDAMYKMYGLGDNSIAGILGGYFSWLAALFRFDLGTSFVYSIPVADVIVQHMGISFAISLIATVFEFMIAIPLGITAATHQYSFRDYLVTVLVMVGISLPSFFFGNMLKDVLALKLGWFPASGLIDATASYTGAELLIDYAKHVFIPILTIVILSIGARMRMTRTNMLEVMNSDYIRTARAKGLSERKVIYQHAFRNTLIPLVTIIGGSLPGLFSGALITETLYSIPGIGFTSYHAMVIGDIPFSMFYMTFLAILTLSGNLLSDILYAVVDPRVRIA